MHLEKLPHLRWRQVVNWDPLEPLTQSFSTPASVARCLGYHEAAGVGGLSLDPKVGTRPSSIAPDPAESRGAPPPLQDPSPLRGTLGSSLRSPAEGEASGENPHGRRSSRKPLRRPRPRELRAFFSCTPPPEKDLESPSSTRLEALVPSRDSRARTRSPSPRAWGPVQTAIRV